MKKQSQGRRLIAVLKRKAMTCMELHQTGISTCWWKRVDETLHESERLIASKGADGLNRYRVISASSWTA